MIRAARRDVRTRVEGEADSQEDENEGNIVTLLYNAARETESRGAAYWREEGRQTYYYLKIASVRIRLLHSSGRTDFTFPTAVCTFSLRTCLKRVKDREPTAAPPRLPARVVSRLGGGEAREIIRRVTPDHKEEDEEEGAFLLARVIGGTGRTCRHDAL